MSVPVQTDAGFAFGNAELVVERGYHWGLFGRTYDVSPDGERFLMILADNGRQNGSAELIYVLNWGEELKRLVLAGGARCSSSAIRSSSALRAPHARLASGFRTSRKPNLAKSSALFV